MPTVRSAAKARPGAPKPAARPTAPPAVDCRNARREMAFRIMAELPSQAAPAGASDLAAVRSNSHASRAAATNGRDLRKIGSSPMRFAMARCSGDRRIAQSLGGRRASAGRPARSDASTPASRGAAALFLVGGLCQTYLAAAAFDSEVRPAAPLPTRATGGFSVMLEAPHPFARFVNILGRGKTLTRSLTSRKRSRRCA